MKQSPVGSRTKSSKGFKVKHFMQTFLLLVISVWLIYQLKHSYDKKEAALRGQAKAQQETIFRLGRKDLLHPIATTVIMGESSSRSTSSVGNGKQEMDVDQVKIEDIEGEGRSSGDDVERTEAEESEEVEDHIDVDDTESGGKGNIETDDNTGLLGNEQDDDDDDDELKAT